MIVSRGGGDVYMGGGGYTDICDDDGDASNDDNADGSVENSSGHARANAECGDDDDGGDAHADGRW